MNPFDKAIIKLDLEAKTKEDAFIEMSDMLYQNGYIYDKKEFIKALYEREKMGITGLGNHVAIPHGKSDSVKKIGIAIGKASHDIEWETHDGKPVRIILMFAVKNDNEYEQNHLLMLSKVAAKLANEELLIKLLSAESKDQIIEILS